MQALRLGDAFVAPRHQRICFDALALANGHDRTGYLAPLLVLDRDHRDVADARIFANERFDVRRIHVEPAGDDHVLLAVDDVEVAVVVEPAHVARAQERPPVGMDPGCVARRLGLVVIAKHHRARAPDDLADLTARQDLAFVVDDLDLGPERRHAHRTRLPRHILRRDRRPDAFGEAPQLHQARAELRDETIAQRRRQCRARRNDAAQARPIVPVNLGPFEQRSNLRWNHEDVRGALALDRIGERVERERREHRARAADRHGRNEHHPRSVGEGRRREERHRRRVDRESDREQESHLQPRPVGVNDPLRHARRPGRIDDAVGHLRIVLAVRLRSGACDETLVGLS